MWQPCDSRRASSGTFSARRARLPARPCGRYSKATSQDNERARGYVLDDQGALRKHMAIFIDGRQVRDRIALTDSVDAERGCRLDSVAVGWKQNFETEI